jgi:hypothetical protein
MKWIKISRNEDIKILLFADDQVKIANSEDTLHISIHKLERVTSQYGLQISKSKTKKKKGFKGSDPVRSKIVKINNISIEQTNTVINKLVS